MTFTIKGFTVNTAEQVRSIMLMAKLHDDQRIVDQCLAVLNKIQSQAQRSELTGA